MNNVSPKVTIIGIGSIFFGRQAIWQMIKSPYLNGGTLGIVDTNPTVCEKFARLAKEVAEHEGVKLKIEASTNRRDVLKGSDFVILSFAKDTIAYRELDCAVSLKYGIRMCSGDTVGPGGIFRTLREFPVIMQCIDDVRELCPDAWVINYINPTAAHGIGLMRYASDVKSFALCDGQHMPMYKKKHAVMAGIIKDESEFTPEIDRDFVMETAGVNHFTWMIKAEYKGENVMPKIAEFKRTDIIPGSDGEKDAKALNNHLIGYELYKVFGCFPTTIGHTKEYIPFWQGRGILPSNIPELAIWYADGRRERTKKVFEDVDNFLNGTTPIGEYMTTYGRDHATDIVEAMVSGETKEYYINTANRGAVPNMNDDAFLELKCFVNCKGIFPQKISEMPRGVRGLSEALLDSHELAVKAAVECDRDILLRAMLTDPLINSIEDAKAIMDELLEAEKDALPAKWFK